MCGMWALWMARNDRRHGQETVPLKCSVQWAADTAFDLWQAAQSAPAKPVPTTREKWSPPPSGWTKCNVDAAFNGSDHSASSGLILRDSEGRPSGGGAKWYEHSLSATAAEARACCDGLRLAQDRGIQKVILETDCQVLICLWNSRAAQRSEIAPLLDEMEELSRSFQDFKFCFVSRTCNFAAHECARLVSRNSQVVEWHVPPPGLADIINSDCNPVIN